MKKKIPTRPLSAWHNMCQPGIWHSPGALHCMFFVFVCWHIQQINISNTNQLGDQPLTRCAAACQLDPHHSLFPAKSLMIKLVENWSYRVFFSLIPPLKVPSTDKLIWARLGVSRPIYVNVDSPNLGFPDFNFLGGYQ